MAATAVDPRVAEQHGAAMLAFAANAHSSEHAAGVAAQEALEEAGKALLESLDAAPRDLLFTPGASPALWLAVEDCIARATNHVPRIAVSQAEHPSLLAILRQAERDGRIALELLQVDQNAVVLTGDVEQAVARRPDLLCVMAANNEIGTVTNIEPIVDLARANGVRLLVDASQAAGKMDLGAVSQADMLVVSGTKIYGPRRSGALIGTLCSPAQDRANTMFGSPDVPAAIALAYAMKLRTAERHVDEARIKAGRDKLEARLLEDVPGLVVNGASAPRLSGALHVSTPHLPGDAVVARLWARVAVSTGAACQSGSPAPSHVLRAMGLAEWVAEGAVRIGIGRFNDDDELAEAAGLLVEALRPISAERKYA